MGIHMGDTTLAGFIWRPKEEMLLGRARVPQDLWADIPWIIM